MSGSSEKTQCLAVVACRCRGGKPHHHRCQRPGGHDGYCSQHRPVPHPDGPDHWKTAYGGHWKRGGL